MEYSATTMLKRWMLLSLGCVLVVAGCHSESNRQSGGSSAESGGALKIVFIPKVSGNSYFKGITQGFEDASKEIHADFTTQAPSTGDATSQIQIIKDQIQRGVDVIALAANSPDALNPVLDQARAKGITVITVDSDLTGNESHRDAAVLGTDFTKIGSSEVELLGSLINYSGPIAILSATTDAPNQNVWIGGMKETLKQPKYAKMSLVDVVYGDDDQQKSTTESQALLSKHPDLRGIISPTFVGVQAAAQTMQLAGVYPGGPHATGGGIQLTGLCTPNSLKSYVQKGVVSSFQLWNLHDMGYIAVYLGQQNHTGKLKAAEGVDFTAGSVGKRTTGKLNVVVAGPLLTFDKTNIDKFDF